MYTVVGWSKVSMEYNGIESMGWTDMQIIAEMKSCFRSYTDGRLSNMNLFAHQDRRKSLFLTRSLSQDSQKTEAARCVSAPDSYIFPTF